MRVVAGELKGRTLLAPRGKTTRPTTDRTKEAVFSVLASMLGPDLSDAIVLDAFAGSGGLGIEALSRGASRAVFVEKDPRAFSVLTENVDRLELNTRALLLRGDAFALAKRGFHAPFSLILLDPPYTLDAGRTALLLADLARAESVEPGCVVVWEHARDAALTWPAGFAQVSLKRYGSTSVSFGRFVEGESP